MIKLSYIIPAYNASTSIRQTLDAIFALPLPKDEYEVIVIDDYSTDETVSIIENLRLKIENLTLLRQSKNQRQGAARNRGIDLARGEYIAFCDADDCIVSEGVMNALHAVEKSHADICYFDFEYQQADGQWIRFDMPKETRNAILAAEEYLNNYYTCYYNAPWRCLYRRNFLQSTRVRFEEGVRWEDCDWTVKVYAKADMIQFVDGVGYRYAWNDTATSRQMDAQAMSEQLKAGVRLTMFAYEIENELPGLANTISEEAKYRYVINNIRLRNLTKYRVSLFREVYSIVADSEWKILERIEMPRWESLVVKSHIITLAVLSIACPLAAVGRKMVAIKRQIK